MSPGIYQIIKKIQFSSPGRVDVLIFDQKGSEVLVKYVLYDLNYTIFYSRFEKILISPKLLYYSLKQFIPLLFRRDLKFATKVYCSYILGFFDCVDPKVAITFIDNNPIFDWLSKNYSHSNFYSVQNGLRTINEQYMNKNTCSPESTHVPNFLCFGENEIDYYKKSGSKIENFYPVGSLKGSIYKYYLKNQNTMPVFDICLISQYRKPIIEGNGDLDIKEALDTINQFLSRLLKETGLNLCIAFSTRESAEFEYFNAYFDENFTYFLLDKENFTVYKAMDLSKLILTHHSTAAIESFGWGKKILMCNFCKNQMYSFDFSDVCTANVIDYHEFKVKLLSLLNMDNNEYMVETKDIQKYMMNYDPNCPVNMYLRNIILEKISE